MQNLLLAHSRSLPGTASFKNKFLHYLSQMMSYNFRPMRYKLKYIPTFKKRNIHLQETFKKPSRKTPVLYLSPSSSPQTLCRRGLEDVLVTYLVLQQNTWGNWLKEGFILAQGSRVQFIVAGASSQLTFSYSCKPGL